MNIKLTDTQRQVIEHAADHTQGRIDWMPDGVKGGAVKKVLTGLASRDLIAERGNDWFVSVAGYAALGRQQPATADVSATVTTKADTAPVVAAPEPGKPVRTRDNTKQAAVLAMLRRPEGATIRQICEETDWQAHTTRGFFAGALKKKLGLTITSVKPEGGERAYRVS